MIQKTSASTPLTLKYLALPNGLGGRGGVFRFFSLSQNIPFEEQLLPLAAWAAEKERLVKSGENPSGTVPVIYTNSKPATSTGSPLVQHIATSRYLARIHSVTSGDAYGDYVQDLVADEYQGFRDEWVTVHFTGSDDDKNAYKDDALAKYLIKFDALYSNYKTHETFLSVSQTTQQPLWGDAAIFGLLRDHILTGYVTMEELKAYPHLIGMYEAYEKIPAVADWIAKHEN